jgi:hypothetical protein
MRGKHAKFVRFPRMRNPRIQAQWLGSRIGERVRIRVSLSVKLRGFAATTVKTRFTHRACLLISQPARLMPTSGCVKLAILILN